MKDERREIILRAAIREALDVGYLHIQRANVAARADCATGTVNKYFNTMKQLKRAVMRYAISHDVYEIIFQGIANKDPQTDKLTAERKKEICSIAINS